ncbi:hypothetical protein HYH03_017172 [Edaphochlamys debaryana]|uniref:Uncharacterized protein n=1 Tax=Edaphochlamys debaryana TaxID=47281 RepID=A0A835XIH3_9CHLO|nr:hypothetical protein HYH03_017172 [Edaphochlamys debaryana]|eukprot:KAG2484005.1 hypothetical protein HYH03_017172 [Edaphochlamys debaryana]
MARSALIVLALVGCAAVAFAQRAPPPRKLAPTTTVDPIVGIWSKIEAAYPNSSMTLGFHPFLEVETRAFYFFKATNIPGYFEFTVVCIKPDAMHPITQEERTSGPSLWHPVPGLNVNYIGAAIKLSTGVYDLIVGTPYGSGTGRITSDGKEMRLYATGTFLAGTEGFPGLHRQSKLTFPAPM